MSAGSDQRADETYRDQDGDDRYDEGPHDEERNRRFSYLPAISWGWWPTLGRRDADEEYGERAAQGRPHDEDVASGEDDEGGSLWDEGLITLLIVGGLILFLIPEPATSGLGILLIGLGVLAWLVDWAT